MRFHFAVVPVHGSAGVERELNMFLGSHQVLGVEMHLVADEAQSVSAICVTNTHATSPDLTNPGWSDLSGCAVERSPGLHLSGFRTWWP